MSKPRPTPAEIASAFEDMALVIAAIARQASDVAYARRTLFNAYRAEGFTDEQSLELCKVLTLS